MTDQLPPSEFDIAALATRDRGDAALRVLAGIAQDQGIGFVVALVVGGRVIAGALAGDLSRAEHVDDYLRRR